jgi:hypothetical protein
MEGVVVRQKGGLRIVLTVNLIMQSVAVEVDASEVEPVDPNSSAHREELRGMARQSHGSRSLRQHPKTCLVVEAGEPDQCCEVARNLLESESPCLSNQFRW